MIDKPRKKGYIFVTWLTKLLSGEEKCWWRAWYKTRFQYEKIQDSEDRAEFFAEWTKKHDAMQAACVERLTADGYLCRVEEAGEFKLEGRAATLAGKPDVVAIATEKRTDEVDLVIDQKSGKRRESDKWQVRLYLYALPRTWYGKLRRLVGMVEYRDGLVDVGPLTPEHVAKIEDALRRVSGDQEPETKPSAWECKYCDVANCPDRYSAPESGTTDVF